MQVDIPGFKRYAIYDESFINQIKSNQIRKALKYLCSSCRHFPCKNQNHRVFLPIKETNTHFICFVLVW